MIDSMWCVVLLPWAQFFFQSLNLWLCFMAFESIKDIWIIFLLKTILMDLYSYNFNDYNSYRPWYWNNYVKVRIWKFPTHLQAYKLVEVVSVCRTKLRNW